jgi:TonB family protein
MVKEKSHKKEKQFIERPEYPGGKRALQNFIATNLRYPQDALETKVQGVVTVSFEVNDNGLIESAKILKGLSTACDQEALRLVHLLRYGKAFNHGIRVKTTYKINIHFKIPQQSPMEFSYVQEASLEENSNTSTDKTEYTYSIHVSKE